MDSIKNYKLKDFMLLDAETASEYINILKHLEPIQTKNRLINLNLGEVEFIKRSINDDAEIPEIYQLLEGVKEVELMEMDIVRFYSLLNDIIQQIEGVLKAEEEHLTPTHTNVKWEAVEGSKRLSVMGVLPLVDNLANGDILKYDEIMKIPYQTVFNKLKLDTINSDLEYEMNKIKTDI